MFNWLKRRKPVDKDDDQEMSYNEKLHDQTIRECKLLYTNDSYGKSWCCGEGWYPIISRLSYRLEALNILYKRYNLRVEAAEVKEKFGTLRFYCSVSRQIPLKYNFMSRAVYTLCEFVRKHVDFRLVKVTDRNEHMKMYVRTINEDDHDRLRGSAGNNITVSEVIDGDDSTRRYIASSIRASAETHKKPTRYRILYYLYMFINQHASLLDFSYLQPHKDQMHILETYFQDRVYEYTIEAERDCHKVCETCGKTFVDSSNPRCETVGYVKYLCEKCASKTGRKYIKDGKMYLTGEFVEDVPTEDLTERDL